MLSPLRLVLDRMFSTIVSGDRRNGGEAGAAYQPLVIIIYRQQQPLRRAKACTYGWEWLAMSDNQVHGRKETGAAHLSQSSPREYNSRSCILCNQRKVRCDKNNPCDRCIKAREKCIYPGPKRAPRKLKRPPIAEILAHVRDLENELIKTRSGPSSVEHNVFPSPEESSEAVEKSPSDLQNQHGRLISKEGKSRYVGDKVSIALGDKVSVEYCRIGSQRLTHTLALRSRDSGNSTTFLHLQMTRVLRILS